MSVGYRISLSKDILEELYHKLNRREYVHSDPIGFLYDYPDVADREIVALIAASLAYGRVAQIHKSIITALHRLESPAEFVRRATATRLKRTFADFKHRFTTGEAVASLLYGVGRLLEQYGSLHQCFVSGLRDEDETILDALGIFVGKLTEGQDFDRHWIVASPEGGSACKRFLLFLRWMIRTDEVDPGGWDGISPSKLVMPVDTHIHRLGLALNLTRRKQADIKTASEITAAFRQITPEDPVRYDFALTRIGIQGNRELLDSLLRYKDKSVLSYSCSIQSNL